MTGISDKLHRELKELPSTLSTSGLLRVQDRQSDAWTELTEKFFPVVYSWCRCAGLQPADASDVSQEVFKSVLSCINNFQRESKGATFRGWLRRITQRRVLDYRRQQSKADRALGGSTAYGHFLAVADLAKSSHSAPQNSSISILKRLQTLKEGFEPTTWTAFLRMTVDGCSAADVAQELGISTNAVYLAKSRVLAKLRDRLAESR